MCRLYTYGSSDPVGLNVGSRLEMPNIIRIMLSVAAWEIQRFLADEVQNHLLLCMSVLVHSSRILNTYSTHWRETGHETLAQVALYMIFLCVSHSTEREDLYL
jgi:hypothetical protein